MGINHIVLAADGDIDATYLSGTGFDANTSYSAKQLDNKIVVVGGFTSYNGTPANRIIRLNTNGTVDTSFVYGTGFDAFTDNVAIQSDGKIIVTGSFTSYNGTPITHIARLNTDGTLDSTFGSLVGYSGAASTRGIAIQPDGKIIFAGQFTGYNSVTHGRIFRLNSDGTLDTTFNAGTGANQQLNHVAIQPDGKIIIVGQLVFTSYNGTPVGKIARLNSDGTIDGTFLSGLGFDGGVRTIGLQSDGKIILGSATAGFTTYDGASVIGQLVRLNPNGTLDTSFNVGTGIPLNTIATIAIQPSNQKIYLGGVFTSYNGILANNIVRLNTDGSLDTSFAYVAGFNGSVSKINFLPNDKLIITGSFTTYQGLIHSRIVSLHTDTTFPVISPVTITSNNANSVYAKTGDIVTLSWTIDDEPTSQTITIGGQSVTPTCSGTAPTITCTATLTITALIPITDAVLPFSITTISVGGTTGPTMVTTNGSSVTVDRVAPIVTIAGPTGTVTGPQTLTGSCEVGLSVNISGTGFTPSPTTTTCAGGTYSVPINITANTTITVSQIDAAGNTGNANTITTAPVISSGGGGAVLIIPNNGGNTSPTIITGTTQTTLPTKTNNKTYISPLDSKEYTCRPFTKYLKLNSRANDVQEVKLWQAFLNKHMGEKLPVTGYYSTLTFNAIKRFQQNYEEDVLIPWGITSSTGWTYKSTRAKGNQLLGCTEGAVLLDNGITINLK